MRSGAHPVPYDRVALWSHLRRSGFYCTGVIPIAGAGREVLAGLGQVWGG
jgi:hypothetical protein